MTAIKSAGKGRDVGRIAGGETDRLGRVTREVLHLRMAEEIGDQRRSDPRRLAQHLRLRRQSGAEQMLDQRKMRAAEHRLFRRASAQHAEQRPDMAFDHRTDTVVTRPRFDQAGEIGAGLLHDLGVRCAQGDLVRVEAARDRRARRKDADGFPRTLRFVGSGLRMPGRARDLFHHRRDDAKDAALRVMCRQPRLLQRTNSRRRRSVAGDDRDLGPHREQTLDASAGQRFDLGRGFWTIRRVGVVTEIKEALVRQPGMKRGEDGQSAVAAVEQTNHRCFSFLTIFSSAVRLARLPRPVGTTKSARRRFSASGICRARTSASRLRRHSLAPQYTLILEKLRRADDDDGIAALFPAGLEEQRDIQHRDASPSGAAGAQEDAAPVRAPWGGECLPACRAPRCLRTPCGRAPRDRPRLWRSLRESRLRSRRPPRRRGPSGDARWIGVMDRDAQSGGGPPPRSTCPCRSSRSAPG